MADGPLTDVAGGVTASEDAREVALHPTLAALFAALDREGVGWCVLRGETDLLAPAGDVDLLVASEDLPRMQKGAEALGFARLPAWGYGSHAFFLTYDASRDLWIKLDVVTELAFGPGFSLATGVETECLGRRRRARGIPLLLDADAFWALLLHELLDKEGAVAPGAAARLDELALGPVSDGPLARFVESVCPPGWSAERIVAEVERGDWAALAGLAPRLAAAWRRRRGTDVRRRTIANGFWRWAGKGLRLSRRRGLGVALLGPDGAGKSTLAAELERSSYFPVRSVYMGLYQQPLRSRVGLPGRLGTQWARWLEGAYHRRRGRLVLFDRYSYEALVPNRFRHSRRGRARRWLLGHSCPPPDLVVLLDAPGELLYARKGEHDVALLETQRAAYRALVARLPRAVVVDASRDVEAVRPEVTAAIWGEYVRRWNRTRRRTTSCGS
jgi:thymidylate kinase